jgi:nucleotide-binding universal stress UspA family protein
MYRNILVAIDGSVHAEEALVQAVDLARREHSRLTIMTAEMRLPVNAYLAVAGMALPLVTDSQVEAQQVLRRALERVPPDLPVTTILTEQPLCAALRRQIKEGGHDLLVLGFRAHGTLRMRTLSSLGCRLLRRARLPMLIVRDDCARELTGSPEAEADRSALRLAPVWGTHQRPVAPPGRSGPAPAPR